MPPASESQFEPVAPERASAVHPTAPVEPGGVVAAKYRIERNIGFGGMGVICEATHLELGTKVAIKFVRIERAGDDRAVARFLTEARSAAQLRSQHTCRVMDVGRLDSGSPYMVMEYLEGADLRSIISAQAPLPVEDSVCFVSQALEALAEAHARHIVHRDIKPENLFLTQGPDGTAQIKVLDFGISKQLSRAQGSRSLTEPSDSIGSPYHMSPEQMVDPTGVDARTDIWAIGVVLYEMLTGKLPFTGETTPQICANVMTVQPKSPLEYRADLPAPLAAIVMSCIEKDREKRISDVGALTRALGEFGGARSGLAAARVERILDRAKGARSVRGESMDGSGEPSADDADQIAPKDIPGLSRTGHGRSIWIAVGLGCVIVLGGVAYLAAGKGGPTDARAAASSDTAGGAAMPSAITSSLPVPMPVPAASAAPERPADRPAPKSAKKTKPAGPHAGAGEGPAPRGAEEEPASEKSNLYPEPKQPDLPEAE